EATESTEEETEATESTEEGTEATESTEEETEATESTGEETEATESMEEATEALDVLEVCEDGFRMDGLTETYTVSFLANGGTGKMNPQTFSYDTPQQLSANAFKRTGYEFAGWSLTSDGTASWKDQATFDPAKADWGDGTSIELYAVWKKVTYKITYKLNGGKNSSKNPTQYTVDTATVKLESPTRDGYSFKGWYKEKQFKTKVTEITKGSAGNLTLYAKWSPKTYKITYKLNNGKNNKSNPAEYTIETKTITLKNPTRSGYGFAGWYTDKKFKNKITKIPKGSTGKITLYAKWEKEYKATSTSAKITSCKATGENTVKVKATIDKRVKSSDTYYYLVTVDPNTDKILRKVAKTEKSSEISFKLDTSKDRGYALAKYAIAVKSGSKYVKISKTSANISNPEKLAVYTKAYNLGKTKKGLQTGVVSEATETGCSNIFLNLNVSSILYGGEEYTYNGKTYNFGTGNCSGAIAEASQKGLNVTVEILLDETAYNMDKNLVAKEARASGHPYYTWNTKDKAGREKMEAMFCFLAEKFGTEDRYVSNWILGNEVNADYAYNWRGSMSDDAFISSYAYTFRCLYSAVRSVRSSSRVFICLDDMWCHENTGGGIKGKKFLDTFVKKINSLQKNVSWNIAFHPYTPKINDPAFWSTSSSYDRSDLVTSGQDSPFITMKNLNVLTKYVKDTYGDSHRIIISEIGFNAGDSEKKQAAALAYAYNIAACNSMVDAFIIRSYNDEGGETAAGLYFGINNRAAYKVFKYMDTKNAEKYTKKYIKTCGGGSDWKSLVSGYSTKKIRTNNGKK
ncbi:MAG: DUF5722 domain-containing protein, partial [Roseburia sp.]